MTFEAAQAFGERVRNVYEDLGYTVVVVPRDTIGARARFIVETLEGRANGHGVDAAG